MSRNRTRSRKSKDNTTKSPNHKYGLIPVNNLTYGNPNAEQDIMIREEGLFCYIANHYMDKPYPNNDGAYAKDELSKIKEEMKKLAHEKVVSMSIRFDEELTQMCIELAEKCGMNNAQEFVGQLFNEINPIIMKLKFYYNRIRPFQLANVYSYPLNPMPTISSQSASYPSGHTIQSKVFADVLSFRYPDQTDMLQKFADKCSKSRIILGVHFPSDEIFGLQVAAGIVNDKGFIDRYFNASRISEAEKQQSSIPNFERRQNQQKRGPLTMPNPGDVGSADESGVFGGLPKPGPSPFGPK